MKRNLKVNLKVLIPNFSTKKGYVESFNYHRLMNLLLCIEPIVVKCVYNNTSLDTVCAKSIIHIENQQG